MQAEMAVFRGMRVLMPHWRMSIVRPKKPIPPNEVIFRVDVKMTKPDIKEYLRSIYHVNVKTVRTELRFGGFKTFYLNYKVLGKKPDYKLAYVTMHESQTFSYPKFMATREELIARDEEAKKKKKDEEKPVAEAGSEKSEAA